jgi:hypothetical protein
MNTSARLVLLTAALLVGFGMAAWADASATHFQVKGDTAIALFEAVDPEDSCIEDTVVVIASETMEKLSPEGHPTSTVRTVLVVGQVDVCLDFTLLSGEGEVFQAAFRVAGNQRSATLTATVPVLDLISQQIMTFDVNLTWTAQGKPVFEHTKETFRDPETGITIITQLRGFHVDAVAAGTTVEVAGGRNFTPSPSESAELHKVNDGTVIVQQTK